MFFVFFSFPPLNFGKFNGIEMKTGSFGGMYFNSPLLVMYFGNPSNDDIPHLAIVPALERNDTDELVGLAHVADEAGVDGAFVGVGAAAPGS